MFVSFSPDVLGVESDAQRGGFQFKECLPKKSIMSVVAFNTVA